LKHREEFRKLQPMRMNVFRRYWDKFKFNRKRREKLCAVFNQSDDQFQFFLGDSFKPWYEELGVVDFLEEMEAQQLKKNEDKILNTG